MFKVQFRPEQAAVIYQLVALAGIEPARPCGLTILSRVRLPIPPQGRLYQAFPEFKLQPRVFCVKAGVSAFAGLVAASASSCFMIIRH